MTAALVDGPTLSRRIEVVDTVVSMVALRAGIAPSPSLRLLVVSVLGAHVCAIEHAPWSLLWRRVERFGSTAGCGLPVAQWVPLLALMSVWARAVPGDRRRDAVLVARSCSGWSSAALSLLVGEDVDGGC